jgi:hypothetical protein
LVMTSMPALLIADGTTYGLPLCTQVVIDTTAGLLGGDQRRPTACVT